MPKITQLLEIQEGALDSGSLFVVVDNNSTLKITFSSLINNIEGLLDIGNIVFDNTVSGLIATNLKQAIDEISEKSGAVIDLEELGDIPSPIAGKYLKRSDDGLAYEWADVAAGASTLESLTDVDITNISSGDTLVYNSESGKIENKKIINSGPFTADDTESSALEVNKIASMQDIYNNWVKFSISDTLDIPTRIIERDSWTYDSGGNTITSTIDSQGFIGFISPTAEKYDTFGLVAQFTSAAADDDIVALVIAHYNENTLSLIRSMNLTEASCQIEGSNYAWALVKNFKKADEKLIAIQPNFESTINAGQLGNWSDAATGVTMSVIRQGDIIVASTSYRDSTVIQNTPELSITVDLSLDPDLEIFRGPKNFGFGCFSQDQMQFKNIFFTPNPVYYKAYDYGEKIEFDVDKTWGASMWESLVIDYGTNCFILSDSTSKLFFIKSDETIIPAGTVTSSINDLSDIDTATVPPTNGQALIFDTADSTWKPSDVEGIQDITQTFKDNGYNEATVGNFYPLGFSIFKAGADGVSWNREGMVISYKTDTIISQSLFDGFSAYYRREIPLDNSPFDDFSIAENDGTYDRPDSNKWALTHVTPIRTTVDTVFRTLKFEQVAISSPNGLEEKLRGKWAIQNNQAWELEIRIAELYNRYYLYLDFLDDSDKSLLAPITIDATSDTSYAISAYSQWGGTYSVGNLGVFSATNQLSDHAVILKFVGDGAGTTRVYRKIEDVDSDFVLVKTSTVLNGYTDLNFQFRFLGNSSADYVGDYAKIDYLKFNTGQVRMESSGELIDASFGMGWSLWTGGESSLGEATDVDITTNSPADGQALVWDEASGKWIPGTPQIIISDTIPDSPTTTTLWLDTSI